MWKISLVGHSQLPWELDIGGAEVRVFRAPGGRANSFHEDETGKTKENGRVQEDSENC